MQTLHEIDLAKIKKISENVNETTFIIEPLVPGYGMTLGTALRRVLLSSLGGAAISSVKINGASHEFSTLPDVKEDVVEIILNLKGLRIKSFTDEPVKLKLNKKGPGKITANDFDKNSQVEIIDKNFYIATLDKNGKISMEVTVERGRGYVPIERKKDEKLPLGTISIDSIFTPIRKAHYTVESTRVGGMTNFDKLTITITTDGTISAEEAFAASCRILIEYFNLLNNSIEPKKNKTIVQKKPKSTKKPLNPTKKNKKK